jgi:hypothetical protein
VEIINQNQQNGTFSARGVCPHCSVPSLLFHVAGPHWKGPVGTQPAESNCLLQCQNCQEVTFVIATRHPQTIILSYKASFPLGNPAGSVDIRIPENVRNDFVEALFCETVQAYKATVVMCRRALQSSCKDLGAEGSRLIDQIDNLFSKGRITEALKKMAHEIRKLGNAGAHPDDDLLSDVTKDDAEDIVEFTEQYFEHIYVMPARMAEMMKRRAGTGPAAAPSGNV